MYVDFSWTAYRHLSDHVAFSHVKAAMQERLRKKAELQAQARKPMGYGESMEAERRKQKSLEKTKEERRQALCEELGRGC